MQHPVEPQLAAKLLWAREDGCPVAPSSQDLANEMASFAQRSADQAEGDKPSNIGVGKAVGISRDPDRAPSALSGGTTVLTRLDRTSQRAKADPEAVFNNLFSMLNYELMWYAFRRLKRGNDASTYGRKS